MSIKGFSVGGNVERYDYNFLDNRPSEITIDTDLSDSSTNPVQNRVVTNAINAANGSISSVSGEVDDLKSAIDKFYDEVPSVNLFNPDELQTGKYYKNNNGNIETGDNTTYNAYLLTVEPGNTYTFTGFDYIAILAKNGKYRGTSPAANNTTITIAQDADINQICISLNKSKYSASTYMIVKGSSLPEEYVPFGSTPEIKPDVIVRVKEENIIYKEFHVGAGYEYTSFYDCIRAIENDDNKKTVYIHGGVYDLFAELGGSEYALAIASGTPWYDVNVIIPPNTKIVGIGYVELQFLPTAQEIGATAASLLSPLNTRGSCEIENIVIRADNCRYCIHDESSGVADFYGAVKKFRGVKCFKTRTGNVGYGQAYAAGIDKNQEVEFHNCHFEAPATPFSIHNRLIGGTNPLDNSARITISECVFVAPESVRAIKFGSATSEQQHILTLISNSFCSGYIEVANEDASATTPKNPYDLSVVRCGSVSVSETATNNIYQAHIYA